MQLETILKQYGLNQKQAKVYLAALELGSAPVGQIAEKADLPRSTTYITLEHLRERGLASSFKKKKVKWFSAQDPKTIIDLTKQKLRLMEESLPQLLAVYNTATTKPDVRFYQGQEGPRLILEEILTEAKELLSFSSSADLFRAIEDYPDFVKRRTEKRIPVRVIARDSELARERKKTGVSQLRQMKLMPTDFPHHGTIYIWDSKVAILSFGEKTFSLVIESEQMMLVQKSMFEMIWRALPN